MQSVSRDSIGGFVISRGIKLRGLIIDRVTNLERNEWGLISVIVRKCSTRSLMKRFLSVNQVYKKVST